MIESVGSRWEQSIYEATRRDDFGGGRGGRRRTLNRARPMKVQEGAISVPGTLAL